MIHGRKNIKLIDICYSVLSRLLIPTVPVNILLSATDSLCTHTKITDYCGHPLLFTVILPCCSADPECPRSSREEVHAGCILPRDDPWRLDLPGCGDIPGR